MPTREDYIYAAGLFDGEGSAAIHIKQNGARRQGHSPTARVKMTDEPTVRWLKETFGGCIVVRPAIGNASEAYEWKLEGRRALAFYREVFPFLRTKRRQAILMLEYARLPKANPLPAWLVAQREFLREYISELNLGTRKFFKRRSYR